MKRKAEEDLELEDTEKKQRLWSDGKDWVRGDLLGQGSFGSVFLAIPKDEPTSEFDLNNVPKLMAVKSADISASGSIQHEAHVLAEIKGCPFVIESLGGEITTTSEDAYYNLKLEFAAGGTLADLMGSCKGHGLPHSDVRRYTRCIIEGLKHIHKRGYVHCDLKPENVLLFPIPGTSSVGSATELVAKIADLGLAKRTDEDVDGWRGTPRYTDPEALINELQTQASDIWSVGAIVLEMLTGRPPWDVKPGMNIEDFLDTVAHEFTLKIPTELPYAMKRFLRGCLAPNPLDRLTAANLLLDPFIACCSIPIPDHPTSYATVPRIKPPPGFEIAAGL